MDEDVRPVRWVGSALRDLKTFPRAVQRDIDQAIFAAQRGKDHPAIKALKGFQGASVLEIVAPFETDTYRSVCTVQFGSRFMSFMSSRRRQREIARLRTRKST